MIQLKNDIVTLASRQHGLVSRSDLRAIGVRAHQLRRLVADRSLEPAGSRAFRICGAPSSTEQVVMAACMNSAGVACGRTAAWLHGIDSVSPCNPPEVLVDRRLYDYRRSEYRLHTTTWLPSRDVIVVRGIPCTNIARTLLGLAALSPREIPLDRVRGAVDEVVRDKKAADPWLWWHLERVRCRGRRGVANLESILQIRAGGAVTESWLEREYLRLMEQSGLPIPKCQRRVGNRGAFAARVDFVHEDEKLVVEVSGYRHHSTVEEMSADARRRADLLDAGYRVLEFSHTQVVAEPAYVAERVRSVLAQRTPG